MSIHNLKLLTDPGNYGNLPCGPRVCIALESYATAEWPCESGKKKRKFLIISPDCVTPREIDGEVNRLIQELEKIRKQSKRFFQRAYAKPPSSRKKRSR